MQPTSMNQDAVVVKAAPELQDMVERIALGAGADTRNAERVSEALISANLCGVDTHGVWHLPGYVERIRAEEIIPTAWPGILAETPTTALAMAELSRYDEALAAVGRARELDPANPNYAYNAGLIYFEKGDLNAAQKTFPQCTSAVP